MQFNVELKIEFFLFFFADLNEWVLLIWMSGFWCYQNLSLFINFRCIFHLFWDAKFKFFFHQGWKEKKNNCLEVFFQQILNVEFRFLFQCSLILHWNYAFNLYFRLHIKLELSSVSLTNYCILIIESWQMFLQNIVLYILDHSMV